MKEQFERVVAWAKAHPALAAGVLGVIVLLAYLAYKNGMFGGGGGSSSTDTSTSPTSGSGTTADTGATTGSSTGTTGSGVTTQDIGQSSTPIPVSAVTQTASPAYQVGAALASPTANTLQPSIVGDKTYAPFTAPTALPAAPGYSGYNRQTGKPVVGKANLKYQANALKPKNLNRNK